MGRALSRKAQGGLVEESGADFFFGVLVTEGSPVVGHSIQAAGGLHTQLCPPAQLVCLLIILTQPPLAHPPFPHIIALSTPPAPHGAAGLRNLDGQYVTSVRRGSELVHAVGPEFMLATGDVLYLSGERQRLHQRCGAVQLFSISLHPLKRAALLSGCRPPRRHRQADGAGAGSLQRCIGGD